MTIYKLSIVVPGRRDIGGIQNLEKEPQIGDILLLGREKYKVVDLMELMPPRGNFVYLHAICQPIEKR
ncbi:MAG: hypothetical protein U0401_13685 [Anaerolineae bacterium]